MGYFGVLLEQVINRKDADYISYKKFLKKQEIVEQKIDMKLEDSFNVFIKAGNWLGSVNLLDNDYVEVSAKLEIRGNGYEEKIVKLVKCDDEFELTFGKQKRENEHKGGYICLNKTDLPEINGD